MSLLLSMMIFVLMLSATAYAEIITGQVVGIVDGDRASLSRAGM